MVKQKWFRGIGAAAVALGMLIAGGGVFYAGYRVGTKNPETIIVKGITNIDDKEVTADFSVFWEALKKLKEFHVDGETTSDQAFVYGAVSGIAGALKDPNTVFFPPEAAQEFEENIRGSFGGIGAEIGIKNDQLVIVAPLKGSPSERVGLRSGDKILEINASSTAGIAVSDAVKLIRGPVGTKVVLNMFRDGWVGARDIPIVRETIMIPNLDYEIKEGNIVHLKLYNFNQNALASFYNAAADFARLDIRGMVLDLRDNPGGYLDSAVSLAGFFLERGKVVASERFRSGKEQVFKAQGNELFTSLPIVVLINQGSASASEILAGALKVHRKVKLVGEKSFGKGTVQELHDLHLTEKGKSPPRLKITIAGWYLPDGKRIEKNGLIPDVTVPITEEDVKNKKDPQLAKALELLKAEIIQSGKK